MKKLSFFHTPFSFFVKNDILFLLKNRRPNPLLAIELGFCFAKQGGLGLYAI